MAAAWVIAAFIMAITIIGSVGKSRAQYRRLYFAAFRQKAVRATASRPPRHRHRTAGPDRNVSGCCWLDGGLRSDTFVTAIALAVTSLAFRSPGRT